MKKLYALLSLLLAALFLGVATWGGSYASTRPFNVPEEYWREITPTLGIVLDADKVNRIGKNPRYEPEFLQGTMMTKVGGKWYRVSPRVPHLENPRVYPAE